MADTASGSWTGLTLGLAVFGFNALRDALGDLLDPRFRTS